MARTAVWEQTVAELVRERGEALFRYALLLCGDPEDAQDLVQDALVRTFGRLRNGFTVESAEAYVRRAILNANLDRGRRASRWRRIAPLEYRPDEVEAPSGETDRRIDLHEELQKLSPRERACVVLRYYDDLKVDDIAERLGISSGAVKRYLSDGLAKMALALAEDRTPEAQLDGDAVIAGARARRTPRAVLAGGLGSLAVLAVLTPAMLAGLAPAAVFDTAGAGGGVAENAEAPLADDDRCTEGGAGGDCLAAVQNDVILVVPAVFADAGAETTELRLELASISGGRLTGSFGATVQITASPIDGTEGTSGPLRLAEGAPEPPVLDVDIAPGRSAPFTVSVPTPPPGDYELIISLSLVGAGGESLVLGASTSLLVV